MILLGLGSNSTTNEADKSKFIQLGLAALHASMKVEAIGKIYESSALGAASQSTYLNTVVKVSTGLGPDALLRKLKIIEHAAGRRSMGSRRWSSRVLDLDIIDYKGRILNWDRKTKKPGKVFLGNLILPHAQAHLRPFVLKPLLDIVPDWKHPVFHTNVDNFLKLAEGSSRTTGGQIISVSGKI